MSDVLTSHIRRAVAELVNAAPLPPDIGHAASRPSPRRTHRRAALAGTLLVALVAGVGVLNQDSSTTVSVGQPSVPPTDPVDDPGAVPLPTSLDPTFVSVSAPPAGLQFIEGGTGASTARGLSAIVAAGPSGSVARLTWTPTPVRGMCASAGPVTTVRGPNAATPAVPAAVMASTPAEATFTASGDGGFLQWCRDDRSFTMSTIALGESEARTLAATVRPVAGRPDDVTLDTPPGFVRGRPTTAGPTHVLVFRPNQALSARPQLTVRVRGAWTNDVRLLKAEAGVPTATEVNIGGRPAFLYEMPGGPRYLSLTVIWDDRTSVTLSGDGLSFSELRAAAASLGPADPALAPDVQGDPGRCSRLSMCG